MSDKSNSDTPTPETQVIYDGHLLRLEVQGGKWEIVRHADAVAILALNDAGEMLLVRQRRPAIGTMTLEAPAGLIDEGETPEEAARRELQEEVGLDGEMTLLTRFYSSPGYCDEELYVYRARNLRERKLPQDADEDIEVVWLPPRQVLDGLRDGTLQGSASTVTAALYAVQVLTQEGR
ncbi:NUDIX domain-containing protein [Deinococcus sp. DB0503]|uniref:NUDIX domain-containing protein n=1 Tax=Deinococcus sp. DB0503 TaxID=2479203 RepID=UPI0018DF98B5|nr:NUDIX hydrolase [Deinococcus sp. DB0503]MBI0446655.1 NUDIX hydrolase [Deinococcus sp. DB0503]